MTDLAAQLADALDGVLPRMAFVKYGQFYNDDPDFDLEAYYLRAAEAIIEDHPDLFAGVTLTPPQPEDGLREALADAQDATPPDGFVTIHGAIGPGTTALRGFAVEGYRAGAFRVFHRFVTEAALRPAPAAPAEVSCCELACYEDPGCACKGCSTPAAPKEDDHE